MAAAILKGLNFPMLVSSAEIDAQKAKFTATVNCTIENISRKDAGISFSRLDGALPFFPADAAAILEHAPILEELNAYQLKITGLARGNYEVKIGGVKVAERSHDQLAEGVNLAKEVLAAGPIAVQSNAVRAAVETKNRFHHDRIFRGIVLSQVAIPEWLDLKLTPQEIEARRQAAITERLAKLPELDAEVAKSLIMKPNLFEISLIQ